MLEHQNEFNSMNFHRSSSRNAHGGGHRSHCRQDEGAQLTLKAHGRHDRRNVGGERDGAIGLPRHVQKVN